MIEDPIAPFEGTQLYGDTLPLDANRGTGQDKIGFTLRQPCGIVVAINYPALLVLQLGASCPVTVLPDADLEQTAAAGGYVNAGQVCISVQRVTTIPRVNADFLDALVPKVEAIRTGDPSSPGRPWAR